MYCPYRFNDKHEAERHQNSLHLRQYTWSCGILQNPRDAFKHLSFGVSICCYCGTYLLCHPLDEELRTHLVRDHRFGECNEAKNFFRADHFRQHLIHSHGAVRGTWTDTIEDACGSWSSDRAVASSVDSAQTPFVLQPTTMCMTPPSIPDKTSLPLPPHHRNPETHATLRRAEQLSDDLDTPDSGTSTPAIPGSRPLGEGVESSDLSLLLPKRRFRHLIDAAIDGNSARKRRMSSPLLDLAKDRGRTSPTTPVCGQAATVESGSTEDCTKSPASPPKPISAAEGRRSESLHVCSMCQRSFARRNILINHERTHTGEKPFSCTFEDCSQTFAQQCDKTRHEQAQHTEKAFMCGNSQDEGPPWGCGKKFRRKDGLLEHHSKTKKGKQCLADRDKMVELKRLSNEDSLAIP